jgi:hypothetical protein
MINEAKTLLEIKMKRVSVTANDSVLVDAIASILAAEMGPDVLQLTYHLTGSLCEALRDHRSMLIMIDEGESELELLALPDSFTNHPLLVIKADLKTMNIDVHKSYPLMKDPSPEQVTRLVRDFHKAYLGRMGDEVTTWAA